MTKYQEELLEKAKTRARIRKSLRSPESDRIADLLDELCNELQIAWAALELVRTNDSSLS